MNLKKRNYTLFYMMMLLPLVMVIISVIFLPPVINISLGDYMAGDDLMSKYYLFMFPAASVLLGSFLKLIQGIHEKRRDASAANKNYVTSIISLAAFDLVTALVIYRCFTG